MKLSKLLNKKIIITAGPTAEYLDPVRYMTNRSSGKMGIALADAAFKFGLHTVLIKGIVNSSLVKGKKYTVKSVISAIEMLECVMSEICDNSVLIMAAAPADYRFSSIHAEKIKKNDNEISITLVKNPDILKSVSKLRNDRKLNIFLAGFAAETNNLEAYARKKLIDKNIDIICANDVSDPQIGFDSDFNSITLFRSDGARKDLSRVLKKDAAKFILKSIDDYLEEKNNEN